jgi:hypothetical protein
MPRTGPCCSGGGSAASYAIAHPDFWIRPRLAAEGLAGVTAVHPGDGAGDSGDVFEQPVVEQQEAERVHDSVHLVGILRKN